MIRGESTLTFLVGFVVGGITVALLDPRRGAARRALLRDKTLSAVKDAAETGSRRARDLRQRLRGVVYEAKARMSEQDVPDDILVERVRDRLELRPAEVGEERQARDPPGPRGQRLLPDPGGRGPSRDRRRGGCRTHA